MDKLRKAEEAAAWFASLPWKGRDMVGVTSQRGGGSPWNLPEKSTECELFTEIDFAVSGRNLPRDF